MTCRQGFVRQATHRINYGFCSIVFETLFSEPSPEFLDTWDVPNRSSLKKRIQRLIGHGRRLSATVSVEVLILMNLMRSIGNAISRVRQFQQFFPRVAVCNCRWSLERVCRSDTDL